jgi:phage gp29-like protein
MEHNDKVLAIKFIRPNAQFVLNGDDLTWLDENQDEPTPAEIESGWVAYQAKSESDKVARATQKAALLDRLGITEEEAKLLLA